MRRRDGEPVYRTWNCRIRRTPTPAAVARLAHTHGWDAVLERWSWIDRRTLGTLAAIGRQPTNERIAA